MNIYPYLCFEGRADEALACYKNAIGAEASLLMCFGVTWMVNVEPEEGDRNQKARHAG